MDPTQGTNPQDDNIDTRTPEEIERDAAEDALFEAGFNDAAGDEPGTRSTTTTSATAAAAPGAGLDDDDEEEGAAAGTGNPPAAGNTQPQANDDDAPVTLTRRQLAELTGTRDVVLSLQNELRRSVDVTNGRFGSIQQTLKEVKEQAGKGIRPSFEQMEALEEDFPELAGKLKRDLTRIFGAGNETQPGDDDGQASGAPAPGADPFDAPEVRAALRDAQLAVVEARHQGWRALPATPEWATWASQLPPVQQELLRTTRDAATLSDALDDFKAFRERKAAATSANNQRDKRLEHAVPATTGSSVGRAHVPSEDEAFEAAFNKARR